MVNLYRVTGWLSVSVSAAEWVRNENIPGHETWEDVSPAADMYLRTSIVKIELWKRIEFTYTPLEWIHDNVNAISY